MPAKRATGCLIITSSECLLDNRVRRVAVFLNFFKQINLSSRVARSSDCLSVMCARFRSTVELSNSNLSKMTVALSRAALLSERLRSGTGGALSTFRVRTASSPAPAVFALSLLGWLFMLAGLAALQVRQEVW